MFWCSSFKEEYINVPLASSVVLLFSHTSRGSVKEILKKFRVMTLEKHRFSWLLFLIEIPLRKITAFFHLSMKSEDHKMDLEFQFF